MIKQLKAAWALALFAGLGTAQAHEGRIPERSFEHYCQKSADACPIVDLSGEWAFEKGQLLGTDDIMRDKGVGTLSVPGTWSPVPLNPWSPLWNEARDIGTYGLVLRNLPPMPGLALELNSVHAQYRVFWRPLTQEGPDPLIFQLGWNEAAPLQGTPDLRTDLIPLPTLDRPADYGLVIQVANGDFAKGGLRVTPRIGPAPVFERQQLMETLQLSLLIGAMLIIALYHLLLFQQRRSDPSSLWLAIQCFSIAAHTAGLRGIAALVWPDPSYAMALVKTWMIYAPHIIGPVAFYGFLSVHFPLVRHRSARFFFGIPCALIGLLLLTPLFFISRLYTVVFVPTLTFFVLYIFWRCAVAARSDPKFRWVIGGIVMLGVAGIHDALAGSMGLQNSGWIPWAEVLFIMMQGGMLSKRFAEAYRLASRSRRELEQEVQRRTREIQSVLDTIQQGILTIRSADLKIGSEYSRYLARHFHEAVATLDFRAILDLALNLTSDQKDQISQVLQACLGEETLVFELNQALLPEEMMFRVAETERVFEVDWSPVWDGQGLLEKMLVCLRDVSEVRKLRDQTQQNEEDMAIMSELLNLPENLFKSFIRRMQHHLGESRVLVASLEESRAVHRAEVIRQIFMNIHTVKGSARTLQLKAIAAASHDLEQEIAVLRADAAPFNLHPLKDKFERITGIMDRYQEMSEQKLGWQWDEDRLRVSRSLILDNLQFLARLAPLHLEPDAEKERQRLEEGFQAQCPVDLAHAVREAARALDSMARDLNKTPPQLRIQAAGIMLTEPGQQLIQALFTHILRNAVDHGLEEPSERQRQGKPESGQIYVEARIQGSMLAIRCHDDGRGLNLEKIKARALDKGLLSPTFPGTPESIAALIFKGGLSTKDAITEISGRGVGMDAVRGFMEKIGGNAEVELRGGASATGFVPFSLVLTLPEAFWWVARSPELLRALA